ncbi:MAG: 2-pyrone-4,6-dicarboxylate hydrolase [Frondihabitans sp.]|nr:2-pyrone-4,6-dicarboxylate hydrolase [Frondihabitans sp.]
MPSSNVYARPIFDSHFHIIDKRFPLVPNAGFLPDEFTASDYLARVRDLGVTGGVVVSGSFQEFDHSYLVDALATLGPRFVAVVNTPGDTTDAELRRLAESGVRGIRFNLYRGGSAGIDSVVALGTRAWHVAGLHSELYLDAKDLAALEDRLAALPKASIDHLGMSSANRDVLLRLVGRGLHVKATGFGRLDFDVTSTIRQIHAENPSALMFGTDLPSTRARVPFRPEDVQLAADALPDDLGAVLHDNAAAFYGVGAGARAGSGAGAGLQ